MIVTTGIIMCTIESGKTMNCCDDPTMLNEDSLGIQSFQWTLGVGMMICSLILGARMGIFQEQIYHSYGKFPKEALYYTVSLGFFDQTEKLKIFKLLLAFASFTWLPIA